MVDVDWAVGSYEEGSNSSLPCSVLETQLCWCQRAPTQLVADSHMQNNRQLQHTHSSAFVATALTRLHHSTRTARDKPHIHPHKCSMKLSFNSYKWTLLRLFYSCPGLVFNIFYIVLICEQDGWHALTASCVQSGGKCGNEVCCVISALVFTSFLLSGLLPLASQASGCKYTFSRP